MLRAALADRGYWDPAVRGYGGTAGTAPTGGPAPLRQGK
jgi:hypothetical protein